MLVLNESSRSEIIRSLIMQKVHEIGDSNLFLKKIADGKIQKTEFANYLYNIKFILEHTVPYLRLACLQAKAMGSLELSTFFEEKAVEEDGHVAWAEQDLKNFLSRKIDLSVLKPFADLMTVVRGEMEDEPLTYVIYSYFVETFTVVLGPKFLQNVESSIGVPANQVSVIDNHVELDKDHIVDDFETVRKFVTTDEQLKKCVESLHRFAAMINDALNSIVENKYEYTETQH